jgi:molecular chaperone DnaK
VPQIEVTFDIDANGIVKVSAKDLGTGRQQEIAIKVASGISEAEIKRMVEEAEKYADEDAKKREFQEAVNQAEILVYSTEQTLKDYAERFQARDLEEIKACIANVRAVRAGDQRDVAALKAATGQLQAVMHRFAEVMYTAPDSGDFR